MPLRDIVSPKNLDETWRWEKQIGMFYAESWALVHFIMIERKHPVPNPLDTCIKALATSASQDVAFREAFGTDVAGMEKELREYVRRVTLPAVALQLQVEKQKADDARPISEAEMNAIEGRLLFQAGAFGEAERELVAVVKRQPAYAA